MHPSFYKCFKCAIHCNNLMFLFIFLGKKRRLHLYQFQHIYFLYAICFLPSKITYFRGFGKAFRCVGDTLCFVNLFNTGVCRKLFASHTKKQPLEMHVEASLVQPDHTFSGEQLLIAQYNDIKNFVSTTSLYCTAVII